MMKTPTTLIRPDKIIFQKQPDELSCLATVAAMIINKPVGYVINQLMERIEIPPYTLDVIIAFLVRNNFYVERGGTLMMDMILSNMIYIGMNKNFTDNDLLHSSLFFVDADYISTVFDPAKDKEYTQEERLIYHSYYAVHNCN